MIELFSCRNCVQNCGQSLNIGQGVGFCLQHNSVIHDPENTTCKYLQRKDLPRFVVDEGMREHAAEFSLYAALVSLHSKEPIQKVPYSEKYQWEHGKYDPVTQAIAQYFKATPAWAYIQSFSGGLDGRRSLAHASLVRRYMKHCDRWESSYRLVLGLVQEIDRQPVFDSSELRGVEGTKFEETASEAIWDVVFCRLSTVQEYGWHSGIKDLMWASDSLNGALSELNWPKLQQEFAKHKHEWTRLIVTHAKQEGHYFVIRDVFDPWELDENRG